MNIFYKNTFVMKSKFLRLLFVIDGSGEKHSLRLFLKTFFKICHRIRWPLEVHSWIRYEFMRLKKC